MNSNSNTVDIFLTQLKDYILGDGEAEYILQEPLRAELYSYDQMAQHSKSLAASHVISKTKLPDRLLARLAGNEKVLLGVRNLLTDAVKENGLITPAGEWLLDNFYLIEEQIRMAKKHLPKGYSEGLPTLTSGPSEGLPRVYDIALEIVSHSDGHIDMNSLNNFTDAYQTVTRFRLGELWAVPIMLRLALIENLRRICVRIAVDKTNRSIADYWATRMIETVESNPRNLVLEIADMARSRPRMDRAFVAELNRQLRGKGPSLAQPLNWIEEQLAETGQTTNELVQAENQKQAADQVSVSNSIGSLRLLGNMDWREFVETNSIVEHILLKDPVYGAMDFSTRDRYRHVVEQIAKNSTLKEEEIAQIAVNLAEAAALKNGNEHRNAHLGFFLIDGGLEQTEKLAKMRLPVISAVRRFLGSHPLTMYLGATFLITAFLTMLIAMKALADGNQPWVVAILGIIAMTCVSQFAITLVNFITTLIVQPSLLPRLDFSIGIPEDARTLVVIPSMLSGPSEIDELVEALEVRFLANKAVHLHFGLLTDFTDAKEKDRPEDEALLARAAQKIAALNEKYGREKNDLFFLFHRPRKWNPYDKIWMGYERKRGKLTELNGLLRGNSKDCFSYILGDTSILPGIKYVITLDSDTQLPRESAWKIIATMAHPLNRAVYDTDKKIVTEGYGILQPRVSVSMPGPESTIYALMNGNEPGIDPYTRATSDVYQDLFCEGSFIGKGIYDVDIFEEALKGQLPENRILSHDLLEGCYTRSGLLSDVQLYEKHPQLFTVDMKRRHRWLRGDWQIATWFLPFVPGGDKRWHANPLSALSRWKIFDNIRRSLVPLAFTLFILFGWILKGDAALWTAVVTGVIIIPVVIGCLWDMLRKPRDLILTHHIIVSGQSAGNAAINTFFMMICLPYEAYMSLVLIVRTCWRMLFSHRNLLEWITSSTFRISKSPTLINSYLFMLVEPLIAIAAYAYLYFESHDTLQIASPILFIWVLAPAITWWVSRPLPGAAAKLSEEGNIFVQKLARKTWAFFEKFVTPAENWLPPDNYQEIPAEILAHRTSPTNIGLALLSNLAAHDFGYITTSEFIERTEGTINTMGKLERLNGHFYNWYNILTLQPLFPRYISTVDSGNLAGHLLTLRQGIIAMPGQKLVSPRLLHGINDTFEVLNSIASKKDALLLSRFRFNLKMYTEQAPLTLQDTKAYLLKIQGDYAVLQEGLNAAPGSEISWWLDCLSRSIQKPLDEMRLYAPWLFMENMPAAFNSILDINHIPTLQELGTIYSRIEDEISHEPNTNNSIDNEWLNILQTSISDSRQYLEEKLAVLDYLAMQCIGLSDMEYDFLYSKTKKLLTIGYNVEEHKADGSFYDLLGSEARLGTFVGIAQGKLPQETWFALGRLLTNAGGRPILLSWSGSMFEYLMPLLVMPSYENTLLSQTEEAAVSRQIEYGKQRNVPWGISESCYNMVDASLNYQYRAFGVPGLGLKRGLGEDLVVAPYATSLALMVSPEKAYQNLLVLQEKGFEGKYGFYEAVDYTPSRLPRGQDNVVVQTYMAHHLGMSFLSMAYLLLNKPMQKRFEAEPQFQATLLLLQERIPKASSFFAHTTNIDESVSSVNEPQIRIMNTPSTPVPEVQLLSNGRYHVMVTNSGAGYSRWKDMAVTRWREDVTRDNWGTFCFIRDLEDGSYWSTSFQPTLQRIENLEVAFSQGRADFRGTHNKLEAHTEIVVSPEDDIEMRRIHIMNKSGKHRKIDITSYAEVVIANAQSDAVHPAFSNLFVQTEIHPQKNAIICSRRPKSENEKSPWMLHMMNIHGKAPASVSYETDRLAFTGRGNSLINPKAMTSPGPLGGNQGSVLDPIVAIRHEIMLEPDETIIIDMITGIGETRESCQALIDKYQDKHHKDRVFELAWTHNQVVLRQINSTEQEAQLYTRLANSVLFSNPALRADPSILLKNHRGQSALWPYSISGDLPVVLLKIEDHTAIDLLRQVIQAHTFWRLKGLSVDLVIWNDSHDGYRQAMQNEIAGLLNTQSTDRPGGVFVRSSEQISNDDRILFQTVARIIITSGGGTLTDHINRKAISRAAIPALAPTQTYTPLPVILPLPQDLIFFNGLGGFSPDGKEYVINTEKGKMTPAPWANVIANPNFGTIISESGQAYTWRENAHEMRLTPWANDPVSDPGGEIFYLRDEDSGHIWCPTRLPRAGSKSNYITRHGLGYSVFEHEEAGIHTEMWVFVDIEAPVKFSRIKITNKSHKPRRISVTGYTEWVLGELRSKTSMHIVTETESAGGALFARNPYSAEFNSHVAFFDVDAPDRTITGDRTEFIGRNGSMGNPAALHRAKLSGKMGAGLDACAAIQVYIELPASMHKEITFTLGQGQDATEASSLARRFRSADAVREALEKAVRYWQETVNAIQVETPDQSVNILANGWLTYQTLCCRLWARSGFYQSGGAYGFRDQLQDVLSLMHSKPGLVRQHILLSASRQFKEGDAQHWWHPPVGKGVRTRCSDDFLWLPFVACKYIATTGDTALLDEQVSYLEARLLNADEDSYYDIVHKNGSSTLYDHCVRAINHGLRFGAHGLPLIGTGDWNDGMDEVGRHGKGESIWLAFFLYDILMQFIPVARGRNDSGFAELCAAEAKRLQENIELNGWDGEWYRRAYFDDGTPLGTKANDECQIDSIAQSWSVLSGAGSTERTKQGMQSANDRLVRADEKLIQLLDPAFDKSALNPGYIKGYVPGVRENGGQYTQAAIWLLMAFAKSGNKERAWELLNMINPINHTATAEDVTIYKVEPYVIAADVYARAPHTGRGGWTWYTGSAGWAYQLITETLLGLNREGDKLRLDPCIPAAWKTFSVRYKYLHTSYHITFTQQKGTGDMRINLDGNNLPGNSISLTDDGGGHTVEVTLFSGNS
jgi:cyclic beta-1,2-glucan synthetase